MLRVAGSVTLSGLYVYPIKSCAAVGAKGLRHDRRWMLVDEAGEFLSQRGLPLMALISVRFAPDHLAVGAPGMTDLEVPLRPEQVEDLVHVRVWGYAVRGAPVSEEADQLVRRVPCARCAVTTVNQGTGARGKEPLRTLATYRKAGAGVYFGRNLIHGSPGTIRVGDPVEATPRRSS